MPDYGKPVENNLHWKSTLDFFKSKDDQRLNAMSDDKVKEHDEENILVADGDKKGDAMKRISKESYPGGMSEDEWADVEREYRMGQQEGPRAEGTVQGTPTQLEEEPMSTQRSAGGAKVTGVPADVVDNPATFDESHKLHGPDVESLKNSLEKLMKADPTNTGRYTVRPTPTPGVAGFTQEELDELARDDPHSARDDYPQDPDAQGATNASAVLDTQ